LEQSCYDREDLGILNEYVRKSYDESYLGMFEKLEPTICGIGQKPRPVSPKILTALGSSKLMNDP